MSQIRSKCKKCGSIFYINYSRNLVFYCSEKCKPPKKPLDKAVEMVLNRERDKRFNKYRQGSNSSTES